MRITHEAQGAGHNVQGQVGERVRLRILLVESFVKVVVY